MLLSLTTFISRWKYAGTTAVLLQLTEDLIICCILQ